MLEDVVEVRLLGGFRVYLRFEDRMQGEIDLQSVIEFKGISAPLRNEREFRPSRSFPGCATQPSRRGLTEQLSSLLDARQKASGASGRLRSQAVADPDAL
jgi:hypothetical protein